MNKEREFNMLENADDKTVELLAEVPVLTKEEKERMLSMSKNKADRMKRERNISTNTAEEQVSGVERYNRPKWKTFASMAACVALVGGIAGTVFVIGKSGRNDSGSKVMAQVTDEGTSEVTTVEATTAEKTIYGGANVEFVPEDTYRTAEELEANFTEVDKLGCPGSISCDTNTVQSVHDKNDQYFTYYKVTDSRFTSVESVKEYCLNTVTEELFNERYIGYIKADNTNAPLFKEFDGELYTMIGVNNYERTPEGAPTVYDVTENSFTMQYQTADVDWYNVVKLKVINENGTWKVAEYALLNSRQDDYIAYAKGIKAGLAELDKLECCALDIDTNNAKQAYDLTYYKVNSDTYHSTADIIRVLENYTTGDVYNSYSNLVQSEISSGNPLYTDIDGELYCANLPKGRAYDFNGEGVDVYTIEDNSFVFDAPVNVPGGISVVTVFVTRDTDGSWKAESVKGV
ncbi:MAG: hypothetical protein IKO47_03975 [Ruminococcus sp.]|nr:hypothetical protein [Ruminococcus sp.]